MVWLKQGGWFDRQADREAKRDRIGAGERIGNLVGLIISIIVLWYLAANLTGNTGFFTSSFGTGDQVLLFGVTIIGMAPSLSRLIIGRRNLSRVMDVISGVLFVIAAIWFLSTFPFDFSHVADVLPSSLQFVLSWVSADFVKILLVLGITASVFVLPYTMFVYLAVRRKLGNVG